MLVRHLSGAELTEYADGALTGTRRRRAQEHLGRCERCARALEATWQVVGEVRAAPEADAPYDLRARIAARVAAERPRPVSCRAAREFIQHDLDGALPPLSVGLLRLHLDNCQACAEQQRTLAATTRLVRSLPPVPAPAGIWEKAMAGHRARPSLSWGLRLRPVLAAAAVAAGAAVFGWHSLPQPGRPPAAAPEGRVVSPRPVAAARSPIAPEPAVTQPAAAPVAVARAGAGTSPPPAASAPSRPRRPATVRRVVARNVEPPPAARAIAIASARTEGAAKAEPAVAPPRTSQGLRALAMMAKAVSSESEGRVSLARQLEPWEVFGDETISEVPLTAVVPPGAPGADASGPPSGQPNTGAREARPRLAEAMRHAV